MDKVELRKLASPTFVTINVDDFWWVVRADSNVCIVSIELPNDRVLRVPDRLRQFLRLEEFKTKAGRMGIVVLLRPTRIEFYRADRKIETMDWAT